MTEQNTQQNDQPTLKVYMNDVGINGLNGDAIQNNHPNAEWHLKDVHISDIGGSAFVDKYESKAEIQHNNNPASINWYEKPPGIVFLGVVTILIGSLITWFVRRIFFKRKIT